MRFTDPPSRSTTEHDWVQVADRLRSQPDKWLLLGHEKESVASAVRNGKIAALRGMEVATRNGSTDEHGHRHADLYLRYSKKRSK